jgi:hypothetical protein
MIVAIDAVCVVLGVGCSTRPFVTGASCPIEKAIDEAMRVDIVGQRWSDPCRGG